MGLDEVLAGDLQDAADLDNDGNTTELVRLFYHDNSLGSIVALTQSTGAMAESYRYDAYGSLDEVLDKNGNPVPSRTTQLGNPIGFTGRYHDFQEGSNLIHFRARYLDPTLGRFVSRDPLGAWFDRSNLGNGQTYVGGNPFNRVDPLGLDGHRRIRIGDPSTLGIAGDPEGVQDWADYGRIRLGGGRIRFGQYADPQGEEARGPGQTEEEERAARERWRAEDEARAESRARAQRRMRACRDVATSERESALDVGAAAEVVEAIAKTGDAAIEFIKWEIGFRAIGWLGRGLRGLAGGARGGRTAEELAAAEEYRRRCERIMRRPDAGMARTWRGSARTGASVPRLDASGKVHGNLPTSVPQSWGRAELEDLATSLRESIRTRQAELRQLGEEAAHRARIQQEERLLRQVERSLRGS